jgi:hypothetical protein
VYGKGTATQADATAKRTRRGRGKKAGETTVETATPVEVTSATDLPAATDANADEAVIDNKPGEKSAE